MEDHVIKPEKVTSPVNNKVSTPINNKAPSPVHKKVQILVQNKSNELEGTEPSDKDLTKERSPSQS